MAWLGSSVSELGALNAKIVCEVWSAKVLFSTVEFCVNSFLFGGAVRKRTTTEATLRAPRFGERFGDVTSGFFSSVLAACPVPVFGVVL